MSSKPFWENQVSDIIGSEKPLSEIYGFYEAHINGATESTTNLVFVQYSDTIRNFNQSVPNIFQFRWKFLDLMSKYEISIQRPK